MSTISVRVPDKELSIFEEYAKANNKSLSELIREIMIEHIEDEYDKKYLMSMKMIKDKEN